MQHNILHKIMKRFVWEQKSRQPVIAGEQRHQPQSPVTTLTKSPGALPRTWPQVDLTFQSHRDPGFSRQLRILQMRKGSRSNSIVCSELVTENARKHGQEVKFTTERNRAWDRPSRSATNQSWTFAEITSSLCLSISLSL